MSATKTFYDLEADLPKGDKLSMAQLKNKVVLIVNVASKVCLLEPFLFFSIRLLRFRFTCTSVYHSG